MANVNPWPPLSDYDLIKLERMGCAQCARCTKDFNKGDSTTKVGTHGKGKLSIKVYHRECWAAKQY